MHSVEACCCGVLPGRFGACLFKSMPRGGVLLGVSIAARTRRFAWTIQLGSEAVQATLSVRSRGRHRAGAGCSARRPRKVGDELRRGSFSKNADVRASCRGDNGATARPLLSPRRLHPIELRTRARVTSPERQRGSAPIRVRGRVHRWRAPPPADGCEQPATQASRRIGSSRTICMPGPCNGGTHRIFPPCSSTISLQR